jgi:hypothetical protein
LLSLLDFVSFFRFSFSGNLPVLAFFLACLPAFRPFRGQILFSAGVAICQSSSFNLLLCSSSSQFFLFSQGLRQLGISKCGIGAISKNFGFVSSIVGREEGRKTAGNSLLWKLNSGNSPNFGLVSVVASVLKVQRALLRSSSVVRVLPLLLTCRAAALNCMFVVVVVLLS